MDKKLGASILAIVAIILVLFLATRHFNPAPPNHITLAIGDEQTGMSSSLKHYQQILKADGVKLDIKSTSGPFENLELLEQEGGNVSAAFVQDGLGSFDQSPDIESLGSLYYEPIWVFYRSKTNYNYLSQLVGDKISVGKSGHGTQVLVERLLKLSGLDPNEADLINMNSLEAAEALKKGKIDVAILMLPAGSPIVHDLATAKNIKLMDVSQSEAISRKDAAFHHLIVPRGALDLESDSPNQDINLVASTTTLLVRDKLHPALAYLLLKAATEVHNPAGIFEKKGEFPNAKDDSFSLSKDAVQFYKSGGTFWQRYLPYWLAALFDRFILLVIPVVAFVLPAFRTLPKLYFWRLRTKIYQRYGELKFLEMQIKAESTPEEKEHYLKQIQQIEDRVDKMKMPKNLSEYVYSLKGHIQLIRDRIEKL
jgi:TRAP transporter TAXI family solute receptor